MAPMVLPFIDEGRRLPPGRRALPGRTREGRRPRQRRAFPGRPSSGVKRAAERALSMATATLPVCVPSIFSK